MVTVPGEEYTLIVFVGELNQERTRGGSLLNIIHRSCCSHVHALSSICLLLTRLTSSLTRHILDEAGHQLPCPSLERVTIVSPKQSFQFWT